MSLRTINITIPADEVLPDIMSTFTPEESFLMLKIGSTCLNEGRNAVAGLTQKEIYNKIKDETKAEIQKLELDLLVEKELKGRISEETSKMYKNQIDHMEKQIDAFKSQIKRKLMISINLQGELEVFIILFNVITIFSVEII